MIDRRPVAFEPFFRTGASGRIYSVFFGPTGGKFPETGIVLVPPFAEEMNKTRRQVALQSRSFARSGYGTLVCDLFGTGDSDGKFGEANWKIWRRDVIESANWLRERGARRIILWGLRLGCLIAMDVVREIDGLSGVMFWQPVTDGKLFVNQFLRLRTAAEALAGNSTTSTSELRAQLAAGHPLEIAGYELQPELVASMDVGRLSPEGMPSNVPVYWFEIGSAERRQLSPASQKIFDHFQAECEHVEAHVVQGDKFWATTEVTTAPQLIAATDAVLRGFGS